MTNVSSILRSKGPQYNSLDGCTRVVEALTIMNSEGFNYIVVTKDGEYAGLFSEKDYTRAVTSTTGDSRNMLITEFISGDLPIIDVQVSVESCCRIMSTYKTYQLPVFEDFNFMGVVTMDDVLHEMIVSKEPV